MTLIWGCNEYTTSGGKCEITPICCQHWCALHRTWGAQNSPSPLSWIPPLLKSTNRGEASTKTKIYKKLSVTNITIHLAEWSWMAGGHFFLWVGKRKEDLFNWVGYKYSEIILELQGQKDPNVWILFEDLWAFISGLI